MPASKSASVFASCVGLRPSASERGEGPVDDADDGEGADEGAKALLSNRLNVNFVSRPAAAASRSCKHKTHTTHARSNRSWRPTIAASSWARLSSLTTFAFVRHASEPAK